MHGIISVMAETAGAVSSSGVFSDINQDTFAPLVAEIKEVAQVAVPITVTLIGIRKGWSWLKSAIRGA
ncbi:MAG: hypothetical protein K2J39_05125 [Ruminococcus sp.]|nr:hypothetical protein [Ruminococcus sp.]